MQKIIKCLSIHQPYASFLVTKMPGKDHCIKEYETRNWAVPESVLGLRIGIHASKTMQTRKAFCSLDNSENQDPDILIDRTNAMNCAGWDKDIPQAHGAIIGTGVLSMCISTQSPIAGDVSEYEKALGAWKRYRFAWKFTDVIKLDEPIPWKGQQGFFNVPANTFPQYAIAS